MLLPPKFRPTFGEIHMQARRAVDAVAAAERALAAAESAAIDAEHTVERCRRLLMRMLHLNLLKLAVPHCLCPMVGLRLALQYAIDREIRDH